jgi:GntR family transcriptional regulator
MPAEAVPTRTSAPLRRVAGALPDPVAIADPLYKQVRAALVQSLASGEWKPGAMLPNERALANRYGVGISTLRAAIGELAAMKVVVRRQGRGTYVCREDERRNIYRFFHVVRDDGVRELPVSELLDIRRARADAVTAQKLGLPYRPAAQTIYRLRNLLTVAGAPVVVSAIAVPAERFAGLTEARIRAGGPTLYAVYQNLYGIHIVRTDEELRAVRCDAASARILRLQRGEPVLEVRRLARTFHDVPVELRRSLVRTTDYHYALSRGSSGG